MTRWKASYRRGTKRERCFFSARTLDEAMMIAIVCLRRGWSLAGLWKKCATRVRASGWARVSLRDGQTSRKLKKRKES